MDTHKIALLTDSCADIPREFLADKQIFVVPLKILCEDGEYADRVDISAEDVYRRLKAGELPRTSLPSGSWIEETLNEIYSLGFQKVAAVMLSGALSGTFNLMRLYAEQETRMEVKVFDSRSGSLGCGSVLLQALLDLQDGMSWEVLTERRIPTLLASTKVYFSVDTLEYLQRGGRIGAVTAVAGSLLQIKPILSFTPDGQLLSAARARGRGQVRRKLLELMEEQIGVRRNYNLFLALGGFSAEEGELFEQDIKSALPHYRNFWRCNLGATLSVHIGDGILGCGAQFLDF